jgi:RIO-like serine/threonine protein kinase
MQIDDEEYNIIMKPLCKTRLIKFPNSVPVGENVIIAWRKHL